jgi:hypothetical protein
MDMWLKIHGSWDDRKNIKMGDERNCVKKY